MGLAPAAAMEPTAEAIDLVERVKERMSLAPLSGQGRVTTTIGTGPLLAAASPCSFLPDRGPPLGVPPQTMCVVHSGAPTSRRRPDLRCVRQPAGWTGGAPIAKCSDSAAEGSMASIPGFGLSGGADRRTSPDPVSIATSLASEATPDGEGNVRMSARRLQDLLTRAARRGVEGQLELTTAEALRRASLWPSARMRGLLKRTFLAVLCIVAAVSGVAAISSRNRYPFNSAEDAFLEWLGVVGGFAILALGAYALVVWIFRPRPTEITLTESWLQPGVSEEATRIEAARLLGPDWERSLKRIGFPTTSVMLLAARIAAARRGARLALIEVWSVRFALLVSVVVIADNTAHWWRDAAWMAGALAFVAGYWVTWLREGQARSSLAAIMTEAAQTNANRSQ